jgi:imidazolonepropionase-like amidohydrolase
MKQFGSTRRSSLNWLLAAGLTLPTLNAAAEAPPHTVLRAQRILVAPDAAPIADGVVLMQGGKIVAVGPRSTVTIPGSAREFDCAGGVVAAGFQNSHVHFTGPAFVNAGGQPAEALEGRLAAMFSRYGFTTVVDTSSHPASTLALRARIDSGALRGPRILTVGSPLFPPNGLPFYLSNLPKAVLDNLPQPATPEAATALVRANLDAGADGTKLFVATPQANGSVKHMPAAVALAAAEETHRRGKLVMAHPTNVDGLRAALAAEVDVLLHTTLGVVQPWPEALVAQLVARKTSLVPTLKLWPYELDKGRVPDAVQQRLIAATLAQLKQYADAGGQVLFGTDVGYMEDFDPTDEYMLMARAGLTPTQILDSLTTAPAARWNEAARRGKVATGQDADLVVLEGDPLSDVRQFAKVQCTIRGGAVIHGK